MWRVENVSRWEEKKNINLSRAKKHMAAYDFCSVKKHTAKHGLRG
jgi:hypothetical protein